MIIPNSHLHVKVNYGFWSDDISTLVIFGSTNLYIMSEKTGKNFVDG